MAYCAANIFSQVKSVLFQRRAMAVDSVYRPKRVFILRLLTRCYALMFVFRIYIRDYASYFLAGIALSQLNLHTKVGRGCFLGHSYAAKPRLLRYLLGLIQPNDLLVRPSL